MFCISHMQSNLPPNSFVQCCFDYMQPKINILGEKLKYMQIYTGGSHTNAAEAGSISYPSNV